MKVGLRQKIALITVITMTILTVVITSIGYYEFDKNVRQKQTTAVEWARKINQLKPEERMNREWEYVLISEDNFYGLSANGATITDICERCKVSLSMATGDLFA